MQINTAGGTVSIRLSRGKLGTLALSAALLIGPAAAAVAANGPAVPPPTNPAAPNALPNPQAPAATAPRSAPAAGAAAPADPLAGLPLPDLAMAQTRDLKLVNRPDGHLELRFTSTVVNIGQGALVIAARRAAVGQPWSVAQQIVGENGAILREIPLPLSPIWGGDGHNHWHIPGVARYHLLRLSDGSEVGENHKIGFCFFDNNFYRSLPNTPEAPWFPNDHGCAHGDRSATGVRMGLSVGYGDVYRWAIPGQSIDITDLPAGRYRLEGKANGEDEIYESDSSNNLTWIDFDLARHGRQSAVQIIGHGSDIDRAAGDHGSVVLTPGPDGTDNSPAGGTAPQCGAEAPGAVDCSRRG